MRVGAAYHAPTQFIWLEVATFVIQGTILSQNHSSSHTKTLPPSFQNLRVQAVRTILALPPFSAMACAWAALGSGIMRSMGIINLPSRTASA